MLTRLPTRGRSLLVLAIGLGLAILGGCAHAPDDGPTGDATGRAAATSAGDSADDDVPQAGTSRERFEILSRTLAAHVARGELVGVSSLVARHGEVVHFAAAGQRDREQAKPLTRDTIFRI